MTPEEALRHAYAQDIARLPPYMQGMFDADAMAAAHASGQKHPHVDAFRYYRQVGHPEYQPKDDQERELQDQMLKGYAGKGWTPEQLNGRTPESYELSPGGQYLDQLDNRNRLYEAFDPKESGADAGWFGAPGASAWAGSSQDRQKAGYAKLYADQLGRTHAYLPGTGPGAWFPGVPEGGFREILNPENFVGSFTTKMGGVLSDGASLLGTALLRGTDPTAAAGDAAVRAHGADFNRTNPALAADRGWRANDALIQQGRDAHANSEGMTAGDTFRGAIGNHVLPESWNGQVPYAQPVINAGMSFANGMLDGTGVVGAHKAIPMAVRGAATQVAKTGIPGVAKFARSTAKDITGHLAKHPTYMGRQAAYNLDEAADVTNMVELGAELMTGDQRSNSQWNADQHTEEAGRQQAVKQLENLNGQIVRPETTVTKAGKWLSGIIQ